LLELVLLQITYVKKDSGLSKFEAWKNFQNPLDAIPYLPESGILPGYD